MEGPLQVQVSLRLVWVCIWVSGLDGLSELWEEVYVSYASGQETKSEAKRRFSVENC